MHYVIRTVFYWTQLFSCENCGTCRFGHVMVKGTGFHIQPSGFQPQGMGDSHVRKSGMLVKIKPLKTNMGITWALFKPQKDTTLKPLHGAFRAKLWLWYSCALYETLSYLLKKTLISQQLKIAVFPKDPKLDQNFHPQVSLVFWKLLMKPNISWMMSSWTELHVHGNLIASTNELHKFSTTKTFT